MPEYIVPFTASPVEGSRVSQVPSGFSSNFTGLVDSPSKIPSFAAMQRAVPRHISGSLQAKTGNLNPTLIESPEVWDSSRSSTTSIKGQAKPPAAFPKLCENGPIVKGILPLPLTIICFSESRDIDTL